MGEADSLEAQALQAKVPDFLGQPDAYTPPPATVERIETHISVVFLAGAFAYKVKRAVKYSFLDFSTLAQRRAACLNELRINTRTAPELYLEVLPVTIGNDGAFRLGGDGEAVEWVLKMRRFDQAARYDRMAEGGRLALTAMPRLAETIAAFHDSADRVLSAGQAVRPLQSVLGDNAETFAAHPEIFPPEAVRALSDASRGSLAALAPLLQTRARGGYVRHCHGGEHGQDARDSPES